MKFIYFLFETNNVKTRTNKNKMGIVKAITIEKCQSMLKNIDIKKYENVIENNKDDMIIGTNIIKDSK